MDIYDNNNIDSNKCSLMSMVWIDRGIILTLIYQLVRKYKSIVNKKIIINNPEYRSFLSILFPDLVFSKYDQHNKNNFYFNIRQIIKKQDIIIDYLVNYNDNVNTKKVSLIPWYDMNDPIIIYKYSNNNLPIKKTEDFINKFSQYRRCTYDNQLWDAVIEYQIILRYTYFNQDFTFNYVLNLINRFLKGTYLVRKNDKKIYIMPNMINAILQPPPQIVKAEIQSISPELQQAIPPQQAIPLQQAISPIDKDQCDINLFIKTKKEYIKDEIYKFIFNKIGNDSDIKIALEEILKKIIAFAETPEINSLNDKELKTRLEYSITIIHELLDNYSVNHKFVSKSINTNVLHVGGSESDEFSRLFEYNGHNLSVLSIGSIDNLNAIKTAHELMQKKFPNCNIDYYNIIKNYEQSKIVNILLDVINKKIESVNNIIKHKK
jgi:hypothetical protein